MSALDDLKDRIDSAIYTNTEQNITGDGLQTVLDDMVDTMGVSVSQNNQTGHTEIHIGGDDYPVASVKEVSLFKAIEGYPQWEFGQISITDSGWTYGSSYSSRCRTPLGLEFHLDKGDIIKVNNNNIAIYIGFRLKDGTYQHISWTSDDTIIDNECYCVITAKKNDETTFSEEDLKNLLTDITINRYADNIKNVIDNIIGEYTFNGLDRNIQFTLEQGKTYIITASAEMQMRTRDTATGTNIEFINLRANTKTDFTPSYTTYWLNFYSSSADLEEENIKIINVESIGYQAKTAFDKSTEGGVFGLPLWASPNMKLFAHAGYFDSIPSSDLLENSLPAYIKAGELGFYGCENDIQITSDGKFVCIHDSTLDRTTNGTGNVSDYTLSELRELRLKKGDRITDLQIPTMEEYLLVCKKYGMIALMEIKNYNDSEQVLRNIISIIKDCGMSQQTILQHSCYGTNIFRNVTDIPFSAIYTATSIISEIGRMVDGKYYVMTVDKELITEAIVKDMHNKNIPVLAYTIGEKSEADSLMDIGIDGIICNGIDKSDWGVN